MTTDNLQRNAATELASRDAAKRRGQVEALVKLLRERMGQWVPLPEVIAAGGCQYSARIHFARHTLGLRIENRRESGGHSYFRLVPSQPLSGREDVLEDCEIRQQVEEAVTKDGEHEPGFLFPRQQVRYADPEESR